MHLGLNRSGIIVGLIGWMLLSANVLGQNSARKMPKEDVIDVPAMSAGFGVHNLFQSNMVLQREKPIAIWGWGDPGERVSAKFATAAGEDVISIDAIVGDDGTWKFSFKPMSASDEPRSLIVESQGKSHLLENILIGDVWVLGGQSNMEFPLDRVENGQLEIVSANYPQIRVLTVPAANGPDYKKGFARLHEWSSWFGRHYRKGDWDVCSPEVVRELSAIGFVFARRIHTASRVPIGIIDVSRGGTTVETWTPDSVLRKMKSEHVAELLADWDQRVAEWNPEEDLERRRLSFRQRVERFKKEGRELPAGETEPDDLRPGPAMDQNRPGNCYASMMAPLEGLQVKGAIFHQGYNNCFDGTPGTVMYGQVFPEMIRAWREAFGDPAMPFGILSLCTEGPVQTHENFCEMMANPGPFLREAQYQTFLQFYQAGDKNIGFVSTYDLRRRWYHPQLKVPAGERIARWALATQYGLSRGIRWKPAIVEKVEPLDGGLAVYFDEAVGGVDDGSSIVGFAVAGNDRRFQPANAEYLVIGKDDRGRDRTDSRVLVLRSPFVSEPIHFRYAWGRSPLGNLQVSRQTDIPIATQRSDSWPMEATPLGVFEGEPPMRLERAQRRQLQEALKQMDLDRRIAEAKELLKANQSN